MSAIPSPQLAMMVATPYAAQRRAEALRPVFNELAEAAEELSRRGIEVPGGKWNAAIVSA